MDEQKILRMAREMRKKILQASFACNTSAHLGGGLSIVDILATLYGAVLKYDTNNPGWQDRDRFILSKGHGALGLYSALSEAGFISDSVFASFQTNESDLTGHPVMNIPLGIESSNGSLGHGLALAIGLAIAARKKNMTHNIYVLLGNGECNEGSVWEGVMAASQFRLDNLIAIVDNNHYQSDGESERIMNIGDFTRKWESFGWNAISVDGHDIKQLYDGFSNHDSTGRPKAVIANTIKGKGVSFMENNNDWHHNRLTKINFEKALQEMGDE